MAETVVLRASLPTQVLVERFLDAIGREADVDLVVEGRRAMLVPELARRLLHGGRDALAAFAVAAPLLPKVAALLIQARRLGRTWTCQRVSGAREVVVEIRRDPRPSRER